MAKRNADLQEAVEEKPRPVYKIKPFTRGGQRLFDLLQNGEWLETFETTEAAEAEMKHRQVFDSYRYGG